jgi:hypothetical protein
MSDSKDKAKEMFFNYACRHFFIAHDGLTEEYNKFRITEAQEQEWRQEYISLWLAKLSVDDLWAVNRLRDAEAFEALPALIGMADKGDSFAKLWFANAIWDLANRGSISAELKQRALKTTIQIWQSIIQQPFKLTDKHYSEINSNIEKYKSLVNGATPQEYVLNYAQSKLAEAQKKISSKH